MKVYDNFNWKSHMMSTDVDIDYHQSIAHEDHIGIAIDNGSNVEITVYMTRDEVKEHIRKLMDML